MIRRVCRYLVDSIFELVFFIISTVCETRLSFYEENEALNSLNCYIEVTSELIISMDDCNVNSSGADQGMITVRIYEFSPVHLTDQLNILLGFLYCLQTGLSYAKSNKIYLSVHGMKPYHTVYLDCCNASRA